MLKEILDEKILKELKKETKNLLKINNKNNFCVK